MIAVAIKYEAYTRLGEKVTGVLETDSEETAYGILTGEELVPYRLRPVRRRRSVVQLVPALFKPKAQDLIDFTRQLASLLNSGIPLRRALVVQRDQARSPGLKEALTQIVQDIEGGSRFSEASSKHTTIFSDLYLRLLRVGEATGGLPMTLQQLTNNMQRRKTVADKVKRALIYPAISLLVAIVAAYILITFSLPSLTSLLKEFGGELPIATNILITVSDALELYALFFIVPVVALAVLASALMRTPTGLRLRDHVLLTVPVVGKILLASNMFFLTTTLSTLLRGGVPPIEAMNLAEQGLSNTVMRDRLKRVTQKASEGTKLGEAFGEDSGFPPILAQAVITGEMRGSLVDTLSGLSDFYEDVTDRTVSGATELIQPAIIILVAGMVGFVAIAVISGIYSTLGSVS